MFFKEKESQRSPQLLQASRSHLLVIDQQEKFLGPIAGLKDVASRSALLIKAAALLDVPVAVTEQYPKALGSTLPELKAVLPEGAPVLEKIGFSAFDDARFADILREERRGQFILCGVETHVCVLQTAFDLLENMGGQVVVVSDAVASRRESDKAAALVRLTQAGAQIATSEMVIFEWLRKAGTPEFKTMQALVK